MAAEPAPIARDRLVDAIVRFIAGPDLLPIAEVRTTLEGAIDEAGPSALSGLLDRLRAEAGWTYHPPDPLARRIHHLLADRFLAAGSTLRGAEHLKSPRPRLIIFANHLSYADANVVDVLLDRAGLGDVARRLVALAGPKVYSDRQRRFSSLCFGTIKVPQSSGVASEEAVLATREVARAARQALETAHDRLRRGDVLLLFGEGTRSRTAELQRLLPGVARYVDVPEVWIVPIGLWGAERLLPLGVERITPARVIARAGVPFDGSLLLSRGNGDRRLVVDAIGLAIAELLPDAYRGVYRDREMFSAARALLDSCRSA